MVNPCILLVQMNKKTCYQKIQSLMLFPLIFCPAYVVKIGLCIIIEL